MCNENLRPTKETGRITSTKLECHVIKIGWYPSVVQLPFDRCWLERSRNWWSAAACLFCWLQEKCFLSGSIYSIGILYTELLVSNLLSVINDIAWIFMRDDWNEKQKCLFSKDEKGIFLEYLKINLYLCALKFC